MFLDEAKRFVRHAFETDRMGHAYLLVGTPDGVAGELAVFMMQMLCCQRPDAPCGQCDTCRQIAAHTWCDSLWVRPLKKSRIISVDQMRRGGPDNNVPPPYLLPWLTETSFTGGWKTAVLVGADRLNESAASAFLKMLEEPPHHTLLLLLTDAPQQLLPTIRSRCQQIELTEPLRELPEPWYGEVIATLATTTLSGPLAATAMAGRLQGVLDEMRAAAEKAVDEEIESSGEEIEVSGDDLEARISIRYREHRVLLVTTLQRWFRDILALRAGGDPSLVHYKACLETLERRASRLTLAQAMANLDCIDGLLRQLEVRNIPESTILPYWLDRLSLGGGDA